jgi:hypothetical protein
VWIPQRHSERTPFPNRVCTCCTEVHATLPTRTPSQQWAFACICLNARWELLGPEKTRSIPRRLSRRTPSFRRHARRPGFMSSAAQHSAPAKNKFCTTCEPRFHQKLLRQQYPRGQCVHIQVIQRLACKLLGQSFAPAAGRRLWRRSRDGFRHEKTGLTLIAGRRREVRTGGTTPCFASFEI